MKSKNIIFYFSGIILSLNIFSQKQNRHEIFIPDIPGYHTLKCDFHMHTVFSDGTVWPGVRVEEAWLDGLDAIAITDHIEYSPHKDDITINRNRSFEIAKTKGNQMNIIVIHGAEITREYPFGHFNALFINDGEMLNKEKPIDAISAAAAQNAVIQWNHPGWRQPKEIPVWYDFQQEIFNKKMMHVIEIVNETSYYPLAHQWAIDKNLTITANSDIHSPIYMEYGEKIHRPITLVFAKERSESAIKDALLAGRTAVFHLDTLMGSEEFLMPLFRQSLSIKTPSITIKGKQWIDVVLTNISDIPLMISCKGGSDEYAEIGSGIFIPAHGSARITVKGKKENYSGIRTYNIPCVIDNYYVSPRKGMNAQITFQIVFEKN